MNKNNENSKYKYYAFISYKHYSKWAIWAKDDEEWANKIHKYLETWKIPTALSESLLIKNTDKCIKPVFQDTKQMYAGSNVQDILEESLHQSKCLIVICSKELIANQRALIKNKKRPYIYDEIKFMLELGRPIILVWIDNEAFDKSSRKCMPEPLVGRDLKVIEVNNFRKKNYFHLKRRVTAEVAASIFKTNLSVFWDIYERERRRNILWIFFILFMTAIVVLWLFNQRDINMAYRFASDARIELEKGNRKTAVQLATKAYKKYKQIEGLSLIFHQCLDESLPLKTFDAPISVCEKAGIYAAVEKGRWLCVYTIDNDNLLATFDGLKVSNVALSTDGRYMAGYSNDFLRVFDIQNKNPQPLMELTNEQFDFVSFNSSGTLLLTQQFNCNAWKIYSVGQSTPLFQDIIYPNIDKIRWFEERASFLGTDSLLLIYGKVGNKSDASFTYCKAPKEAKWACYLYDLRKKDKLRPYMPMIKEQLEVPEGTEIISAAQNSYAIIMAGAHSVKAIWKRKDLNYGITKTLNYKSKFKTYTLPGFEAYKKINSDWNHNEIVDIKFSSNEKFVLLTDKTNVQYTFSMSANNMDMEIWNGLTIIQNDG